MKKTTLGFAILNMLLFGLLLAGERSGLSRLLASAPRFFLAGPAAFYLASVALPRSNALEWLAWLVSLLAIPTITLYLLINLMIVGSGHSGPLHFLWLGLSLIFVMAPLANVIVLRPWRKSAASAVT